MRSKYNNIINNYKFIVLKIVVLLLLSATLGYAVATLGVPAIAIFVALGMVLWVMIGMVKNIKTGMAILLTGSFTLVGLSRYIHAPLGLGIDAVLVLILVFYLAKNRSKFDFYKLNNPVFIAIAAWMFLSVLSILNPETPSLTGWFYAMRGVSFYIFMIVMLGFLILDFKSDFKWVINLWFAFSVLATLWGVKQLYLGLDVAEKAWLSVPGNFSTHMLFGNLRVFSFYSDAGQFGASQAHTALVAALLFIGEKSTKTKIWFAIVMLLSLYGMGISGTRGALVIPFVGAVVYLILSKNFKIIGIGSIVVLGFFVFLKYTSIGQGNYQIGRMRTALNPNDPSLLVRIENQKKLKIYLDEHILGGGIGSAGYWGQRFSPQSFLANLALDSWYVRIAAEFGYVGLFFYGILVIIILTVGWAAMHKTPPSLKYKRVALYCGVVGILVASYANQVFGQMPTAVLIYFSIVFVTQKDLNNSI